MGVFGDAVPIGQPISTGKLGADGKPIMITGAIPKQVYGAIHYLTDVAPVQKKELSEAYQKVEALNKAAKAGGALPPVNPDGSLKAAAGKLK
jgi:NADH:ubiquinone oxidoreductase subunit